MKMRPGWLLSALMMTMLATGCSQRPAGSPAENGPPAPALTADDNAWGGYLAALGKIHGKDVSSRPYIFLVPDAENAEAAARRKELVHYVSSAIGPVILPGSMLIIGGRSPRQTNAFAREIGSMVRQDALKGSVVLIVNDGGDQDAITKSFGASQATVRFSPMRHD